MLQCEICGHKVAETKEDYFCPDCGAGKELFEKEEEGRELKCHKCGFVYDTKEQDVLNLKEKYKNLSIYEWLCPICNPSL